MNPHCGAFLYHKHNNLVYGWISSKLNIMTNDKIKYSLLLVAVLIVAATLLIGFDDASMDESESTTVQKSKVNWEEAGQQMQSDLSSRYSTAIVSPKTKSVEALEHEAIDQLLANLSEEERTALEIQVVQTSVSKRVNNLSSGSMSEEELTELFKDIDYLDKNAVFLGKEAEQLKIYVRAEVGR